MLKRIVSYLVLLCVVIMTLPVSCFVSASVEETYTDSAGVIYTYSSADGYYTVTDLAESHSFEIVIPSEINSVPVKKIGYRALFSYNIRSVTISEGVTEMGDGVFCDCYCLEFVSIPSTVTSVGEELFDGCRTDIKALCHVTADSDGWAENWSDGSYAEVTCYFIPDSSCFYDFSDGNAYEVRLDGTLPYALIPASYNGLQVVHVVAYENDTLQGVYICDGGVTSVVSGAFKNSTALKEIRLPKELAVFQANAFENCSSLKSITIPAGITEIAASTFKGCAALEEISFSSPITLIGITAFSGCSSLKSIRLFDGLTSIGAGAFKNCTSLTQITVPVSVSGIGEGAFSGCTSLSNVYLRGETVPDTWDDQWLGDCTASVTTDSKNLSFELSEDGTYYIVKGIGTYEYTDVVIPETFKGLPVKAISYMGNFSPMYSGETGGSSLFIPKSITDIEDAAFADWITLAAVDVDPQNSVYYSTNGCVVERDTQTLIFGANYADIPDDGSILHIGKYAFKQRAFEALVIPEGVVSLEEGAFYLATVYPDTVSVPSTLESIGIKALNTNNACTYSVHKDNKYYHVDGNCLIETASKTLIVGNKTSVIPDDGSVTSIGAYAFERYANTTIDLPSVLETIGEHAFYQSSLTAVTVPENVTSIGNGAFSYNYDLETVNGCEGLESIGGSAFYYCSLLTGFPFCEGLRSIGECAFYYCESITSLQLPSTLESLEHGAFMYLKKLASPLVLPSGLSVVPNNCFSYCELLPSVTFGSSVTEVGSSAFDGCTSLKKVFAPDLESWLNITFNNNPVYGAGLYFFDSETSQYKQATDIVIPAISTIKARAFYGCAGLTTVTLTSATTDIGNYAFGYCADITDFYCEFDTKPARWKNTWNYGCTAEIHWDYCAPCYGNHIPGAEATCNTPQKCTVCEKILAEATGEHIPSHDLSELTCEFAIVCTVCGEVLEYAMPHVPGAEADCTNDQICTVCGEVLREATGHTPNTLSATCTKDKICTDCGEVLQEALGHLPGSEATCTQDQLCMRCKTVLTPRTGHTADGEATCQKESICIDCGAVLQKKTDHVPGEWETVKAPTFLEDGEKQRTCINCGIVVESAAVPKYVLDIQEIEKEIHIVIPPQINADVENAVLYDITLTQDNVVVQPDGSVEVRLPLPDGIDPDRARVWHIDENGNVTDMGAVVEGKEIVFVTDHFSYYMIVESDPIVTGVPGDINGDGSITSTDYIQAKRIVLGTYNAKDEAIVRGDLNGNGKLDTSDYAKIKRHVLGTYTIA